MKNIFKNWRAYKKESLKEYYGPHEARKTVKDVVVDPEDLKTMRQVLSIADQTGVLSWPDVEESWVVVNAEPTYKNSGFFVLNVLGAIPFIGKVPQGAAKLARLVGLVDAAKDAGKVIGTAEGGAKMADDVARAAKEAEDAIDAHRLTTTEKAADVGQVAAKTAKVAGYAPQVNKATGQLAGIFNAHGRLTVTIKTETGPVTFMYSSGTSLQMVDDTGRVVSSPRVWMPVGDLMGGRYVKYKAWNAKGYGGDIPDARFGTGNKEIWDRIYMVNDNWHAWIAGRHGNNWATKIWTDEKVADDVQYMIEKNAFQSLKGHPIAKYPSPDSEFGKIAKELERLSPDGTATDELVEAFGSVVIEQGAKYNDWRRGLLAGAAINESISRTKSRILISIKRPTI